MSSIIFCHHPAPATPDSFSKVRKLLMSAAVTGALLTAAMSVAQAQIVANAVPVPLAAGASISTTANAAYALNALNGGTITAAGSFNITTSGTSAYGALAQSGGIITLSHGGTITTNGSAYNLYALGAGSKITGNDLILTTMGTSSAVRAITGGIVNLTGGSITGPGSSNLTQASANSQLILTNLTVTVGGAAAAAGVVSDGVGASFTATGLTINTAGDSGEGAATTNGGIGTISNSTIVTTGGSVLVGDAGAGAAGARTYQPGSILNVINTSLTTRGSGSSGADASDGGETRVTGGSIRTEGANSYGVLAVGTAANSSTVIAQGMTSITTIGASAPGAGTLNNGSTTVRNTAISTSNSNAPGLLSQATLIGVNNTLIADGVTISTTASPSIAVDGGTSTFTLTNVTANTNQGTWLTVDTVAPAIGPAIATLTASASQMTGAALTAAAQTSNVTLQSNTLWSMTANSNLASLTNNSSTIRFSAPVSNVFKTLTAANYGGSGGTLALNTTLAADGSPSDRLIIDSGTTSGSTALQITNFNGAGALTTGLGILVVDVTNSGTTTAGSFALAAPVIAGSYEYKLFRENDGRWYLRSTLRASSSAQSIPSSTPLTLLALVLTLGWITRRSLTSKR